MKQRMEAVHAEEGPHRRPILLFPEGTTTNGDYLLPFRTGAFIAGVPVQPTILKYGLVRAGRGSNPQCSVHVSDASIVCSWHLRVRVWLCRTTLCGKCTADNRHSRLRECATQSRVSPAWETIGGIRHIFLMLANPLHSVTVYEVHICALSASAASAKPSFLVA